MLAVHISHIFFLQLAYSQPVHTVRNIKPEIHQLDLMYEDLDFKYQHNLHDTLLGLKVPTVGFGNPKLSCVKIRSESKSNTLFTLTI